MEGWSGVTKGDIDEILNSGIVLGGLRRGNKLHNSRRVIKQGCSNLELGGRVSVLDPPSKSLSPWDSSKYFTEVVEHAGFPGVQQEDPAIHNIEVVRFLTLILGISYGIFVNALVGLAYSPVG
ncbi:hypothetical protein llap_14917 [Limosa lapponica baueri]|uniref:Uncharacterized protein n=1 Tax=Limosa lapponica baueri TaxID=1758121 RepID=A0A2I0TLV3_LIMLA|nr:hypothetical protein llap_14917 [Limosa lapponica baueri]